MNVAIDVFLGVLALETVLLSLALFLIICIATTMLRSGDGDAWEGDLS